MGAANIRFIFQKAKENINISALSLADTTNFGILRLFDVEAIPSTNKSAPFIKITNPKIKRDKFLML